MRSVTGTKPLQVHIITTKLIISGDALKELSRLACLRAGQSGSHFKHHSPHSADGAYALTGALLTLRQNSQN